MIELITTFAFFGPVVQLDRITDSGSVGQGFESLLGHFSLFLRYKLILSANIYLF